MFRRYGNWGDALAAYNWGPGNLDQWIAAGRPAYRLPFGVARYVSRVMRDALIVPETRL
jgi:soluble lytic murein transglycosylase-like protein